MLKTINRRELAERLGVHTETLSRWAKAGKGPRGALIGGQYLYLEDDVNTWLREQMSGAVA